MEQVERPGWEAAVAAARQGVAALLPDEVDAGGTINQLVQIATLLHRFGPTRVDPIPCVLNHVGNYWSSGILLLMRHGPLRPSMLLRLFEALQPRHPISKRMLMLNLRALERDGLIERDVRATRQAHVEYRLSEIGCELSELLLTIIEWGARHVTAIVHARNDFDAKWSDELV